ncbi:DoxX family protein [Ferruginibacter sp. HRS2-29]|uniref:DoxX family protein n=1 Tax=Ferruginibacter sp. HRS2-29 TaxID=2487334 RepID=UPI0020CD1C20|nr:DoxX family protein [Ferruginibacter sp. HRS2-29]MCP9751397.1 DoxX family protein [Ferruginibacter sp. HRS2-29]
MKKLLSTRYSAGAFNFATLVLRLVFGGLLMANHGYGKLIHFSDTASKMPNFLGIGQTATTALVVFAEFFCALFVMIGLFTRLACIPVLICMIYALAVAHHGHIFSDGEAATLFLGVYAALLFVGPGRVSVDGLIGK